MYIQKICDVKFHTPYQSRIQSRSPFIQKEFGLNLTEQVGHDTVSFTAKAPKTIVPELRAAIARKDARALRDARFVAEAKREAAKTAPTKKNLKGEERIWGVSLNTAKKIHTTLIEPQKKIHNFLYNIFGDLLVSHLEPQNLLLAIKDRAKSSLSIEEKSATRKCNSIQEVFDNITDLNAGKFVMNYKTGKPETESILGRLIPLIKTKQVILKEIELQRPEDIKHLSEKAQEEFDYASKAFLDKLEDAQEEVINGLEYNVNNITLIDRPAPKYTKSNYCALHLLLQLPDKDAKPFEVQIMGARMSHGKDLDDILFKTLNGKEVDKIYKPIANQIQELKSESNKAALEEFRRYERDALLDLRKCELEEYNSKKLKNRNGRTFISINKYSLPPEYDLDALLETKNKCDANAKIFKQNLEEARRAQKEKNKKTKSKKKSMLGDMSIKELKHYISLNKEMEKNRPIPN